MVSIVTLLVVVTISLVVNRIATVAPTMHALTNTAMTRNVNRATNDRRNAPPA